MKICYSRTNSDNRSHSIVPSHARSEAGETLIGGLCLLIGPVVSCIDGGVTGYILGALQNRGVDQLPYGFHGFIGFGLLIGPTVVAFGGWSELGRNGGLIGGGVSLGIEALAFGFSYGIARLAH